MAIEIKELHVRVAVHSAPGGAAGTSLVSASGAGSSGNEDEEREAMIAACVEQVMAILRERLER